MCIHNYIGYKIFAEATIFNLSWMMNKILLQKTICYMSIEPDYNITSDISVGFYTT